MEEIFNPETYKINLSDTEPYDYQEAKRQAEAVFFQMSPFETVMVRFPIVLGEDDYSKRLKFHVDHIADEKEIFFPNLNTKMGFIQSHEAGDFLNYLGKHTFTGPVNAVSSGYISLLDLTKLIENKSHKKIKQAKEASETNHSPFGFDCDFMMPNKKAMSLGFEFANLMDYLPGLVDYYLTTKNYES
ncbi:MAG: hypothetical protein K2Q18_09770 [Bdellovibrionales bacterium]|nr:hypothetical protein [Bdellovibrionales bacterium]